MLKLFPKSNEENENYTSADEGEQQDLDLNREMKVLSVRYHGNQGAWNLVSTFQSHCVFTWHDKVHFPSGNVITSPLEVIEIFKHLTAPRNWGNLYCSWMPAPI